MYFKLIIILYATTGLLPLLGAQNTESEGERIMKICNLPSDTGVCYGYQPSFYYDKGSRECKEFIYGGCGGNANRFATVYECEQVQDVCAPNARTGTSQADENSRSGLRGRSSSTTISVNTMLMLSQLFLLIFLLPIKCKENYFFM